MELCETPQGFTSAESVIVASPGMSETRLVWTNLASWIFPRCAWAFLGMTQRAAMAIRNAYKARECGLQFEAMRVFMGLAFLGEREVEKIRLPFPVPKTKASGASPLLTRNLCTKARLRRVVESLKQTGNLSRLGADRHEGFGEYVAQNLGTFYTRFKCREGE
jgi:hypothetical protein